jgi:hypothetical protein
MENVLLCIVQAVEFSPGKKNENGGTEKKGDGKNGKGYEKYHTEPERAEKNSSPLFQGVFVRCLPASVHSAGSASESRIHS